MNYLEIVVNYTAHLKENFLPANSFQEATHQYSTSELLTNMFQHYGIDDTEKEYEYDRSIFITNMQEMGFNFKMIPGDIEMRWLFKDNIM